MPTQQEYAAAVQAHLDGAAQALGYDSIASAITYAEESEVIQFMQEGRLFRRWRSRVWVKVFALQSAGASGTIDDLIAALPPLHDGDVHPGDEGEPN